jgi:addiction module RelE/StbE family toxin
MVKRNVNIMLLDDVIELLINEKPLPAKYRNHSLSGDMKGFCDITNATIITGVQHLRIVV